MVARIASRTWSCDCCGMENDQRGCVLGPPQCMCYHSRVESGMRGMFPSFCIFCERCQNHCPGSPIYQDPKLDPLYKWCYDDNSPVKKEPKPHRFAMSGICNCGKVDEDEIEVMKIRPDLAPRRIHIVCGCTVLNENT